MILDMHEYYSMVKKHNVNIIYSGPMWANGIEGMAEMLKKRLAFDELPLPASQACFSVFIEQITNMLMYSAEKEIYTNSKNESTKVSKGVFILGEQNKTYFTQSGNIVTREDADLLKERIDYLNTLDKTSLRQHYKEQIKSENNNSQSKGAGLGLIEIARRSSAKIKYSITQIEDDLLFFSMHVTIG